MMEDLVVEWRGRYAWPQAAHSTGQALMRAVCFWRPRFQLSSIAVSVGDSRASNEGSGKAVYLKKKSEIQVFVTSARHLVSCAYRAPLDERCSKNHGLTHLWSINSSHSVPWYQRIGPASARVK